MGHGIYTYEADTSVAAPSRATSGVPFVIGTAPLSGAEEGKRASVNVPVLATSYEEAVEQLGYDEDWKKYTLCEFMYYHFKIAGCQPAIFLAVGEDASALGIKTKIAAATECVDLCMPKLSIIPDLIAAPGFSDDSTIAAVMATKIAAVNGIFKGKAVIDLPGESYTEAVEGKNGGSFNSDQILCWGNGTSGKLVFHGSTIEIGRMAATDTANGGVPYESPSNKGVSIDGLVTPNGTEVMLTWAQANILNDAGICTFLNFMSGYVAWGNITGCYPGDTDVKNYFIPVNRMFDWVANTLIKTFWAKLDKPMNRRLIDTILDGANIWLNGLVGRGYLLGGRVEMLADENPTKDLMAGILRLHVYLTPASPAQEIDFTLEYDAEYVQSALAA